MKNQILQKTTELIRPKALIKNSWTLYKKNFKKLFIISVIFFGIMSLVTLLIGPEIVEYETRFSLAGFTLAGGVKPLITVNASQYTLITLAIFLFSILGQATLLSAFKKIPGEWEVKEAIGDGSKIFWSFLWVSILSGIVIAVGFVLLIIPGILFMVWYAFAAYVLVFEGQRGWSALKRSKKLVKGYWWAILGRLIVLILLAIVVSIAISWIPYIGQLALQVLFPPFSVAYAVLLYKSLKELKEKQV